MKKLLLLFSSLMFLMGSWTLAQNVPASPNSWGSASWVWDEPDADKIEQNNEPRYLRRTFDLPARAARADLWITADNHYIVHLNGHKIGADGEWSSVEKYDVARHLVPGKNVLAIEARNQGGVAGVIARLHVATTDKKEHWVVTDARTRITQKAAGDWQKTDFDDSSWFAAIVLGDAGIGPWNLTASSAQQPGKGPKAYGSSAVDAKVKTRLSAQDQIKHFLVPKDFEIELVAADPVVINPITMVLDDQGRIIVSESHTYRYGPSGSPIKPFANPVVRLDPDGKGGFQRTLVADGFDDPVMGIAVKGSKLWLTANNYLYTYDLADAPAAPEESKGAGKSKGIASNKKAILTDKNKAWNPFGMFVLEWGPDGKLYMSVGNHSIDIQGPDGKISARGSSGMILRMNPDGTKMERLVHGLRVPYSFEYDPFGQLWVLSNGEGNPDRFVRVIDGVDYHCYSRGNVDNNWLAGNHPLAPPCEEVHRGAHTQLMRYFAAAYPAEYQGNLFCCNWGAHGFAGPNRGIFRYVLDERNNVARKETLVACTDPHFRPSHIALDPDGNLLIADWYGRDDESDMTGRIWRLKYVGQDRPVVKHKLDSAEWKNDDYALSALGSPHHLIREKAIKELVVRGRNETRLAINNGVAGKLGSRASNSKVPLEAVNALWTLVQMGCRNHHLLSGASNLNWKVQRLSLNLWRRYKPDLERVVGVNPLHYSGDSRIQLENVLAFGNSQQMAEELTKVVITGAWEPHSRYEAAWHLAKHADEKALTKLLASEDADVRLAGLIAIDVACYENFPTKKAALAALAHALEDPGKLDHQLLLTVAQLDGDTSIVPALEKLIAREDLPTASIAKAVLVLKAKAGTQNPLLALRANEKAGKRLIEAVEKGSLKIATPADQLIIFEFLESEGPTPFALKQIAGQLRSGQPALRQAAHTLARRFGSKSSALADPLWSDVLQPKHKFEETLESLSTLARIEPTPKKGAWEKLLTDDDPLLRAEAVRWWRTFKDQPELVETLVRHAPDLVKKDERVREDLAAVLRHLGIPTDLFKSLDLPGPLIDKEALARYTLKELAAMPAADRPKRVLQGLQVFERNSCTKCHTTATQTTPLAPSLKGIAAQKVDYLIESVLYPSKIIKTGFESETVTTTTGKILTGLVKEDGKFLRVLNMDKEDRIARSDVESRAVSRISIMPDGQEATLSRREFVDLIAYLTTLK